MLSITLYLSNTEPVSEIKYLKSKHRIRIRQLPGCDYSAMIGKEIFQVMNQLIVPSNKKRKFAAMTSSIKDLRGNLCYHTLKRLTQQCPTTELKIY